MIFFRRKKCFWRSWDGGKFGTWHGEKRELLGLESNSAANAPPPAERASFPWRLLASQFPVGEVKGDLRERRWRRHWTRTVKCGKNRGWEPRGEDLMYLKEGRRKSLQERNPYSTKNWKTKNPSNWRSFLSCSPRKSAGILTTIGSYQVNFWNCLSLNLLLAPRRPTTNPLDFASLCPISLYFPLMIFEIFARTQWTCQRKDLPWPFTICLICKQLHSNCNGW